MRRIAATLLLCALASPATIPLRADDQHGRDDHERNRSDRSERYYDSQAKDWHTWNDQEDRAYRRYLEEQHRDYRDYSKLSKKQQRDYWKWRHSHPDADDRR